MLHVLHVITGLDIGGAETMLTRLIEAGDRGRLRHTVVSLTGRGSLGDRIRAAGAALHTLDQRRGRPRVSALFRLAGLVGRERPDVVQTWLYHADLLGLLAARASGRSVPVLWNLRCSDMQLDRYGRLTGWVVRLLAWLSAAPAAVLVNSRAGLELHRRIGYHPRRWELVPNGFDLDRFRPDVAAPDRLRQQLGVPLDRILIGMVARLDPMKDHHTFLAAAAIVAAARPDVDVVLAGRGTETLAAEPAARTLGDRLHLLGERGDIDRLLPGLDLCCLSSAFGEGFPNALGEAMAAGVPCVTTNVGDAAEVVGETGRMVPPGDAAAFAAAVASLLAESPADRRRRGAAARERIATHYALPAVAERYWTIWQATARRET